MQANQQRSYYLHAMGVEQYQEHTKSSTAVMPCYTYLLMRSGQPVAWIVGDATDDAKEQTLLLAIAQALRCEATGQRQESLPPTEALVAQAKQIIAMGPGVAKHVADAATVTTHALATLLAAPHLKAETWQDLQAVTA